MGKSSIILEIARRVLKFPLFVFRLLNVFFREFVRFARGSRGLGAIDGDHLRAEILSRAHSLEKGINMPHPSREFGSRVAQSLVTSMRRFYRLRPVESPILAASAKTLLEWWKLQPEESRDPRLSKFSDDASRSAHKPSIVLTRDELTRSGKGPFPDLVASRVSVRNFDGQPVPIEVVHEAVKLANNSPTSSNRQSIRVRFVRPGSRMIEILGLQNGNRGFSEKIGGLLVVSSTLTAYEQPFEWNQAEIDAGMWTMSLLYSMTYLGYGACTLNWGVKPSKDRYLRRILRVGAAERIVVLVAVGGLQERFNQAVGWKAPIDDMFLAFD